MLPLIFTTTISTNIVMVITTFIFIAIPITMLVVKSGAGLQDRMQAPSAAVSTPRTRAESCVFVGASFSPPIKGARTHVWGRRAAGLGSRGVEV